MDDLASGRQIVHLYALNWNEMALLPFFLEHYRGFVDRFFIFDDSSDDGSAEYLSQQTDVHLGRFARGSESYVAPARDFYNECWKASRGKADWVIIVNIDELIYHSNILGYLGRLRDRGVTAVRCTGWEMVSQEFPEGGPLAKTVKNGVRRPKYDKVAIFDPSAVDSVGYTPGRHGEALKGQVKIAENAGVHLLHFKRLGADSVVRRFAELDARQGLRDRENDWGLAYTKAAADLRCVQQRLESAARPVLRMNAPGASRREQILPGCYLVPTREVRNERGALREIWSEGDDWAPEVQHVYATTTFPGTVKAWYLHKRQTDHIMALSGAARFALVDGRDGASREPKIVELDAANPRVLIIGPQIWHGFQATSDVPALMLHHNNRHFDWIEPDEQRLPADSDALAYRWT